MDCARKPQNIISHQWSIIESMNSRTYHGGRSRHPRHLKTHRLRLFIVKKAKLYTKVSLDIKKIYIETDVCSVTNETESKAVEAPGTLCWRCMWRISKYSGRSCVDSIRVRRWEVIGYVLRHAEDRWPSIIIKGMSDRKRPNFEISLSDKSRKTKEL